jgi:hypothetical protein
MQSSFSPLIIGMPGGAEWILIILSLLVLSAPVFLIIYLVRHSAKKKNEKTVIRKL